MLSVIPTLYFIIIIIITALVTLWKAGSVMLKLCRAHHVYCMDLLNRLAHVTLQDVQFKFQLGPPSPQF
jgi:hypothetical protein